MTHIPNLLIALQTRGNEITCYDGWDQQPLFRWPRWLLHHNAHGHSSGTR